MSPSQDGLSAQVEALQSAERKLQALLDALVGMARSVDANPSVLARADPGEHVHNLQLLARQVLDVIELVDDARFGAPVGSAHQPALPMEP